MKASSATRNLGKKILWMLIGLCVKKVGRLVKQSPFPCTDRAAKIGAYIEQAYRKNACVPALLYLCYYWWIPAGLFIHCHPAWSSWALSRGIVSKELF